MHVFIAFLNSLHLRFFSNIHSTIKYVQKNRYKLKLFKNNINIILTQKGEPGEGTNSKQFYFGERKTFFKTF